VAGPSESGSSRGPVSADPKRPSPSRKRGLWLLARSLLGLAGGLLVAAVAAHFLDVRAGEVWEHIARVPAWATLFCIASSFVVLALQSLRWHRVMGPLLGLRYADAFRAQIVGFLFNALLPARGGDLLRVQYLGLYKALGTFGALLVAMGSAMFYLTRTGRVPREGTTLGRVFSALRVGVLAFRDRRIWATAFLVAPLPWLWETCALTLAGRAFDCDLTLVQAFSVMIAFNLATIVPAPGGVGTIESGGMLALDFFGFNHSSAMAFMTVYHFSQLIPGIVGGATVLIAEGEHLFGTLARAGEAPVDAALGDTAAAEPAALAE